MFSAIFRSLPSATTTVMSVSQDKYETRLPYCRGDGILMYNPTRSTGGFFSTSSDNYDIIIPRPLSESVNEAFSLFRSSNENEAMAMFTVYSEVIPLFLKVTRKCSVASLQEVCDVLRSHRSWSVGHLLAHMDLPRYFNDPEIQAHINDVEPLNGMTPVMLAIAAGKKNTVEALLSLRCDLDILAHNSCSVLHFAASTNKDILECLLSKEAAHRWVNSFNGNGHTPLHVACLADKPDCVSALIISGANANVGMQMQTGDASSNLCASPLNVSSVFQSNTVKFSRDDMKYGGTPLHWCLSKEVIEALLETNCNMDNLNLNGQTALHLMVLGNRLDCAVTLLYHGANHSFGDHDGNSPLHLAVKNTFVDILQALIVFGADVNVLNHKSESPRHLVYDTKAGADKMAYMLHVSGAKRCPHTMGGCSIICSSDGDFDGTPDLCVPRPPASSVLEHMLTVAGMERASIENRPIKGGRLLCLDGGGIRGLILIQILLELEAVTKRPIIKCFDWVAGTSTGGILALALSLGKSLKECQMLYFKLKEQAFIGDRPYSSDGIEKILKDAVGAMKKMSEIKEPKLMITGVLASQKPMKLCIFRNYPSPTEIITNSKNEEPAPMTDEYIWEVARSTSAAPSYFKSFKSYVDGGLIANNPTLDALTEIIEHRLAVRASHPEHQESTQSVSLVVSCGTGLVPISKMQSLDVSWSRGIWETIKMASRLAELGTLLVDLATCTDGRVVDRARAWCSMAGIPYYRFNPQMSKDVAMDETSNKVIIQILWETKAHMFQNRSMVMELAEFLSRE